MLRCYLLPWVKKNGYIESHIRDIIYIKSSSLLGLIFNMQYTGAEQNCARCVQQ